MWVGIIGGQTTTAKAREKSLATSTRQRGANRGRYACTAFEEHVNFAKVEQIEVPMVIIDEQHRFWGCFIKTHQRMALVDKGLAHTTASADYDSHAHTAYPCHGAFGDMDTSVIDELPPIFCYRTPSPPSP